MMCFCVCIARVAEAAAAAAAPWSLDPMDLIDSYHPPPAPAPPPIALTHLARARPLGDRAVQNIQDLHPTAAAAADADAAPLRVHGARDHSVDRSIDQSVGRSMDCRVGQKAKGVARSRPAAVLIADDDAAVAERGLIRRRPKSPAASGPVGCVCDSESVD